MIIIGLICCLIAISIPTGAIVVGNKVAEHQLEITTEETIDSAILNKYTDTILISVNPIIRRTTYYVECLGEVTGPSITFEVGKETYDSVDVGSPLRLAVIYEGDELSDIRLVERNGNVVSCSNEISR